MTILDDDLPPVVSIISTYSAAEGSGANDANGLVVSLTAASARTVKVAYAFNDDTAEKNTDYTGENNTLTFSPSANGLTPTSMFIPFTITQDSREEAHETFSITLSIPADGNATLNDSAKTAVITIIEDDFVVPTISVGELSRSLGENETSITIPVTLSNRTPNPVMIDWKTVADTATGDDFTVEAGTTLEISNGTTENITININNDALVEGNETFTVELSNARNANFSESQNKVNISVTIWDDESLQTFSIFAVGGQSNRSICGPRPSGETNHPLATGTLGAKGCQSEGTDVQFQVIASSPPAVDIPLSINVSQIGDFILVPASGSTSLAEGANNVLFEAGQRVKTFVVQTKELLDQNGDRVVTPTSDGKIIAELQASHTNIPDTNAIRAEVTIWDIDRPRISIEPVTGSGVEEGSPAKFKVSAYPFPTENSFDVRVAVSQIGYDGVAFLTNTAGERTVSLTPRMTTDSDGNSYIAAYYGELSEPTNDDDVDELNGEIVASINSSTTYNINPLPNLNTAVVRVRDNDGTYSETDLPLISIVPTSTVPVFEGQIAQFELRASKATNSSYNIDIALTSTGGDFIDRTASNVTHTTTLTTLNDLNEEVTHQVDLISTQVQLPANQTSVRFSIQTLGDQIEEPDGSVVATVVVDGNDNYWIEGTTPRTTETAVNDPTSNQQPSNIAIVQILDDDSVPEISISAIARYAITEGTNAEFRVSANRQSHTDKVILVNFSETGNVIDHERTISEVTIPAGSMSATYIVYTDDDSIGEIEGEILVTLRDDLVSPANYTVASTAFFDRVIVDDNDGGASAPSISISEAVSHIIEGNNAKFYFTSSDVVSTALEVSISVSQGSGNFLVGTTPENVTFNAGENQVILDLTTEDDRNAETNGTIVVTIQPETDIDGNVFVKDYAVSSSNNSASVTVVDNDGASTLPTISVAANSTDPITEGSMANFTITSDQAISATNGITVRLLVSDGESEFISGTPVDSLVIPMNGLVEPIHVPTVADDVVEADGRIFVTVLADNTPGSINYLVNPDQNSATVIVWNDDYETDDNGKDITPPEVGILETTNTPFIEGSFVRFSGSNQRKYNT